MAEVNHVFHEERLLSNFQNSLHMISEEKESMITDLMKVRQKSLWYTIGRVELSPSESKNKVKDNIVTYTLKEVRNYASKSTLIVKLPEINVNSEKFPNITIAWKPHVGLLIVKEIILKINDRYFGHHDRQSLTVWWNWLEKNLDIDTYNRDFGNLLRLTTPSDCLPEHVLTMDQPWFYTVDSPLCINLDIQDTLTFDYNYNLGLADLLICQKEELPIDFRPEFLKHDIVSVQTPTIIQELLQSHSIDGNYRTCSNLRDEEILHDDFITLTGKTTGKAGNIITVKVNSNFPIKSIFYQVSDVSGKLNFRITDGLTDRLNGSNDEITKRSPIDTVTYEDNTGIKFDSLPTEIFERTTKSHFPCRPREYGMGAIPYCYDPMSLDIQPGINVQGLNTKLRFKLRSDLPIDLIFQIHVVLMITRKDILNRKIQGESIVT